MIWYKEECVKEVAWVIYTCVKGSHHLTVIYMYEGEDRKSPSDWADWALGVSPE